MSNAQQLKAGMVDNTTVYVLIVHTQPFNVDPIEIFSFVAITPASACRPMLLKEAFWNGISRFVIKLSTMRLPNKKKNLASNGSTNTLSTYSIRELVWSYHFLCKALSNQDFFVSPFLSNRRTPIQKSHTKSQTFMLSEKVERMYGEVALDPIRRHTLMPSSGRNSIKVRSRRGRVLRARYSTLLLLLLRLRGPFQHLTFNKPTRWDGFVQLPPAYRHAHLSSLAGSLTTSNNHSVLKYVSFLSSSKRLHLF